MAAAVQIAVKDLQDQEQRSVGEAVRERDTQDAKEHATSILNGSAKQFKELFRMDRVLFGKLVNWLHVNTGLTDTRDHSIEQKLMILLWILAQGENQENAADFFHVSESTVSAIVDTLLPLLEGLHGAFVQQRADDWLDSMVELDPKLSAFNGCIGAIDSVHIFTQKVFTAVRSDHSFSYVLAGGEDYMRDPSLYQEAIGRGVFKIPKNRYYLADSGFKSREGIVIPFPGVKYHLQDWQNSVNPPETRKDLHNFMIFNGQDLDDEEYINTLNPDGLMALEQANQRAERLMDTLDGDSEKLRHTAAILMWQAYEIAKREIH